MSVTFRSVENCSIGCSYYSRSEPFCTHGVRSGNFPARCYLPLVDHVLSFHHKYAVMQVNASACVIRNDPEPVANVNLGATWNGQVPVLFREVFQFEFRVSQHVAITQPVTREQRICGKGLT